MLDRGGVRRDRYVYRVVNGRIPRGVIDIHRLKFATNDIDNIYTSLSPLEMIEMFFQLLTCVYTRVAKQRNLNDVTHALDFVHAKTNGADWSRKREGPKGFVSVSLTTALL